MKNSQISAAFLYLAAFGFVTVSAQEPKTVTKCLPVDVREIRVPKAEIIADERGEIVYKINANETWRRTEIEVKRGQLIEISASGIVRWAQDGSDWTIVTPDGTRPPHLSYFPHPDAGIGSLVMRVGRGIYAAGTATIIEAEDDGLIEFMINDDILADNSGHFLVKLNIRQF